MALVLDAIVAILRKPTVWGVVSELLLLASPLWLAVAVGLVLGWAWKPKWAVEILGGGGGGGCGGGGGGEAAGSASDDGRALRRARSLPRMDFWRPQLPSCVASFVSDQNGGPSAGSSQEARDEDFAVTDKDLLRLYQLVEVTDGGPEWRPMMQRALPNMSYRAWRRDPETGPPQYRSSTIYEDATPEILRDFFWDDQFRLKNKWDDMLIHHETLDECPSTGTMVVHWIRKFPFFCSDREYTIRRRIWKLGRTYYCVTKGVPWPSLPRRNKPRRVDLYYSSWCIRPARSTRGGGQLTACEVLLFHHEDMGIPWEIAKIGVRQGMWGCVKKIEPGLRAYQICRMSNEPLSQSALFARINSNITSAYLKALEDNSSVSEIVEAEKEKPWSRNIPRFLVLSGAVAFACTVDRGLLTKAVIFGVARKFIRSRNAS